MLAGDLLGIAEVERVAALGGLDAHTQSELGQFFTPAAAARLIASMPRLPEAGTLRVLDPGAGSGVLAAALVSRALSERPGLSIEIVAVERDPAVLPSLRATLSACEQAGGGRVHAEAVEADFILDSVGLGASLSLDGQFDLVIENPPYGKLAVSRALGQRSILADPRSLESRDRVNAVIKHREPWRPLRAVNAVRGGWQVHR
ncbi:carbamoyltransferase C-terminal domain-containing protein [Tessaracoccus sp. OH4464_COT-324]|uniref:carbamoyltransferase C-terminal domain-containing protein n=1 Tax=Tessaracoccus sp. OH4464_COT-324 TaxID=2491059 RepID=UPI0018F7B68C|nr:carbamoyltransferase C-terminal domain-containing protein [Tessaracoccus sp. OH4464_COT-324]